MPRTSDDKNPGAKKGAANDKRERILRAATKVFAEKGFYATRVSEIAKMAGVADGTIYLYFENKDDVLISIFRDRLTQLIEVLGTELGECDSTEAKVRRVIEFQLGLLEGRRSLAEVVTVNLRQSSVLLKQYAAPYFVEYIELIAEVIAEGQREGSLRTDINPRIAARGLWGGLDGIALTWALGKADPTTLRKSATQFADIWLQGLRAP